MPKVYFIRRANKAKRKHGIRKGSSYYYWFCRPAGRVKGVKMYSLAPPKRSQLTLSPGKRAYWRVIERVEEMCHAGFPVEHVEIQLRMSLQDLEHNIQSEKEKIDAMPHRLQSSPIHDVIRALIEVCNEACDKIQAALLRLEARQFTPDDGYVEVLAEIRASLSPTTESV